MAVRAQHYFSIIGSALCLSSAIWITMHSRTLQPTDAQCVRIMDSWSPVANAIEYKWMTFFEVAFHIKSIYLGSPTAEVETAWDLLIPDHPISIPDDRLPDFNQSKDTFWIRPTPASNAVLALPEVFVQLSCLNFLRQYTYRNEYDYSRSPFFQGPEGLIAGQVDECLERLRQAFMCWADVTPILKEVLPNLAPSYDMETLHYCRDFEAILEWTRSNGVRAVLWKEELLGVNKYP